jgi:hypothetical protein
MAPSVKDLTAHSLSETFPRMSDAELTALAEDIKANGLKEAIWMFEDKILDGNNRYVAGLKINYSFKQADFRPFDVKTQGDPLTFVVSQNLHRRHLNESQRAAIAARLVSTKLGINQYSRSGITNEQAAKLLAVSEATLKMAKEVATKATLEVIELVRKGELRLGAAKQLLDVPKDQQLAKLNSDRAEKKAKQKKREAEKKANKGMSKPKDPKANQAMKDVDDFKAKWQSFSDVQRRAFVMMLKDELAAILDDVRQQEAILGATLPNAA